MISCLRLFFIYKIWVHRFHFFKFFNTSYDEDLKHLQNGKIMFLYISCSLKPFFTPVLELKAELMDQLHFHFGINLLQECALIYNSFNGSITYQSKKSIAWYTMHHSHIH